jgi:hypothetical protein
MLTPLVEHNARVLVRERQLKASSYRAADRTKGRLVTVRRWQRIVIR